MLISGQPVLWARTELLWSFLAGTALRVLPLGQVASKESRKGAQLPYLLSLIT